MLDIRKPRQGVDCSLVLLMTHVFSTVLSREGDRWQKLKGVLLLSLQVRGAFQLLPALFG